MQHVMRFEGGFERNFAELRAGAGDYESDDGSRRAVVPWPDAADGVRFGFMEQQGKRFVAVRVRYGDEEIVLRHPVRVDPGRHLGGRRFSATPIPLGDGPAGALFADIVDLNPEQRPELTALRERVRGALRAGAPGGRPTHARARGAVDGEKA
jgi:hypothetical protein